MGCFFSKGDKNMNVSLSEAEVSPRSKLKEKQRKVKETQSQPIEQTRTKSFHQRHNTDLAEKNDQIFLQLKQDKEKQAQTEQLKQIFAKYANEQNIVTQKDFERLCFDLNYDESYSKKKIILLYVLKIDKKNGISFDKFLNTLNQQQIASTNELEQYLYDSQLKFDPFKQKNFEKLYNYCFNYYKNESDLLSGKQCIDIYVSLFNDNEVSFLPQLLQFLQEKSTLSKKEWNAIYKLILSTNGELLNTDNIEYEEDTPEIIKDFLTYFKGQSTIFQ